MANRSMLAAYQTGVAADLVTPIFLSKFEFPLGSLRFWTGYGNITFNSETYLGTGDLLSMSEVEETTSFKAAGLAFSLSGVNSAIISAGLGEDLQERFATLWFALLNEPAKTLLADPFVLFFGRMDTFEMDEDGVNSIGIMKVENRLADLERASRMRYTQEEQQRLFADDTGCQFVNEINSGKQIEWGP